MPSDDTIRKWVRAALLALSGPASPKRKRTQRPKGRPAK